MKGKQTAGGLLRAGNIASASHCMTRLRLVLNDEGKANDDAVKAIKGVKSVIKQGGQYQVVIGNEVSNLFKEFKKLGNFAEEGGGAAPQKAEGNIVQRLFGFISGCLTPMLPAMLGTGMVKVLLVLLTKWAGLEEKKAFATCVAVVFPLCAVSAAVYYLRGGLPLARALPYLAGGLVGGAVGGKLFRSVPNVWLRRIFALFLLYGAWRYLS